MNQDSDIEKQSFVSNDQLLKLTQQSIPNQKSEDISQQEKQPKDDTQQSKIRYISQPQIIGFQYVFYYMNSYHDQPIQGGYQKECRNNQKLVFFDSCIFCGKSNSPLQSCQIKPQSEIVESQLPPFAKQVDFPEIKNQNVLQVLKDQGPFDYNQYSSESDFYETYQYDAVQLMDNSVYQGFWRNQTRFGQGKCLFNDDSFYEGYWINDVQKGYGRMILTNGDFYEGQWHDGKMEGQGTLTRKDGSFYRGEWQNGKQNGKGIEKWNDGTVYRGYFLKGKKHGKGKIEWKNGSKYEGQFSEDQLDGNGTYLWKDGRQYNGEWWNDQMNGTGVYTWPDGRKYVGVGQFHKDQREGYGEFTWPEGQRYKGFWKQGKQNGVGLLIDTDGKEVPGEWHLGAKLGF